MIIRGRDDIADFRPGLMKFRADYSGAPQAGDAYAQDDAGRGLIADG